VQVAITGVGVIGPHGVGTEAYWSALLEGRSGIRHLQAPELQGLPASAGGEALDFDPTRFLEKRVARRMGRFSQMAVAAAMLALEDASIADLDSERTGVTVHTGAGGILEGDREVLARQHDPSRTGPLYVPHVSANMGAANVSIHLGITGPTTAGVGACAAGAIAVAEGFHMLQRGDADLVLAGASDAALTPPLVACLANAGALSTSDAAPETVSRPFDLGRTGFVPAEGAALMVLEPLDRAIARGAEPYCLIAGVGIGCDAYHITSPEPSGAGAERVMRTALRAAGASPGDVDCIVAHGTGTRLNDEAEAAALLRVFGERGGGIPVTAPKSNVGHTLGAAGAFGVATAALALRSRLIPPSLNYETPDPACPLEMVTGTAHEAQIGIAIVNAFGFGGQNAVVAVRASDGGRLNAP
jgi:3-oxoacyl-[acyl-carrier-protein] synthase II